MGSLGAWRKMRCERRNPNESITKPTELFWFLATNSKEYELLRDQSGSGVKDESLGHVIPRLEMRRQWTIKLSSKAVGSKRLTP